MTKIKILGNHIIFDGHADTKHECETITLMCDNLAKSIDFKTIKYESGYAEFERIGRTNDLMFAPAMVSYAMVFDSHITKVSATDSYNQTFEWTTSGQTTEAGEYAFNGAAQVFNVTLQDGYIIDTVTSDEEGSISVAADGMSFTTSVLGDSTPGGTVTVTITSKQQATKQTIDVSTLSGWEALASGDHSITVKTKASGYADSASSNAVTVSKALPTTLITPVISLVSEHTIQVDTIDSRVETIEVIYKTKGANHIFGSVSKQSGTNKQIIDLSTLNGWKNLPTGTNSIVIRTTASGYSSVMSNEVTISIPYYDITTNLTNIEAYTGNPNTIRKDVLRNTSLTFTPATGYTLPDTVTVTGAEFTWTKSSGTLVLSNPTSNITVTIVGIAAVSGYSVTINEPNYYGVNIYDGTSSSGTLLGSVNGGSKTVVCTSGDLYLGSNSGAYTAATTVVTGGVTIVSESTWYYGGTFKVTADGTITVSLQCLIEGTQITLADGSTKAIEDITYNDELLVWNFYEGKFDKAKSTWIKVEQIAPRYNLVKFSNGAEVGFVGMGGNKGYHRIFNKEKGAFTYTGNLKETPNGTTTFAEDNTFPTVVSQEIVNKEVKFYNVITDKHYNLFANGILTSCRLSNKYRIEDMKYVGDRLISNEEEKRYFEEKNKLRK